jgi:predicted RNase H-like nuclease
VLRCFGLDAAWSDRNPSALCAVDEGGIILAEAELRSDAEIVTWIGRRLRGPAVVAADLPLLVRADTGMRPCDRAVMRAYASRGAGPHPTNRTLLVNRDGRIRGEEITAALGALGFGGPWDGADRTLLEVYPHPGLIEVFALPRRLAYKKGRVTDRRDGLATLAALLARLETADPPLRGPRLPHPGSLRGRALKSLEDRLDARFCAWTALLWARYGAKRVRVFGEPDSGHIAVACR